MNDEAMVIVKDHQTNLQNLDKKIIALIAAFLSSAIDAVDMGDFERNAFLGRAAHEFSIDYTAMIDKAVSDALDAAKQLKTHNIENYQEQVEESLHRNGMGYGKVAAILLAMEPYFVSSVFSGVRDTAIVGRVMGKVWPDGLIVSDRIKMLSNRMQASADRIIRQGSIEGAAAETIVERLTQHFVMAGTERKAALRLAVHTVNMVYEETNAEIANDVPFIEGIHITRSLDGSAKCEICYDHAGPVGGDGKKYFKNSGTGELWIMAELPPYHGFCKCGVTEIFQDIGEYLRQQEIVS